MINDGGLDDNKDDQEKEDSPMITDKDFDFLNNFFVHNVCLSVQHTSSTRSSSGLSLLSEPTFWDFILLEWWTLLQSFLQNCNPNVQKRKSPTT